MAWGDGGPEIRRQFFTECISAAVAPPEGERADVPEHADPKLMYKYTCARLLIDVFVFRKSGD